MIFGAVDAKLEAHVQLFVEDVTAQTHPVDVIVDTGFSGFLTLPSAQIAALALPWIAQDRLALADGSIHLIDVYSAFIIWDGQSRQTRVYSVDVAPLVGMKLLEGHEVRISVVPGGLVYIDLVP
jgi:clan AA aspartic protease